MTFEWDLDELWRSKNGRGPLLARVLCVTDGIARMERWPQRGGRRTRFELRVDFLCSKACGWERVEPQRSKKGEGAP